MVKVENFPNAYKEVYEILKSVPQEDLDKIPKNFIEMIEKGMNKEYTFYLDSSIDFEELKLMLETRILLSYIFLNYWATETQKETIKAKFKKDLDEEENKKRQLYDADVFKNKRKIEENNRNKLEMVVYKKENFIIKIFNKIKRFLGLKFKNMK